MAALVTATSEALTPEDYRRALIRDRHERRRYLASLAQQGIEQGSYMTGHPELGREVGQLGDIGDLPEGHRAANIAGAGVGRLANRRGVSGGRAAALGGAVAGALQGQSAIDIAKTSLSWYILWFAFGYISIFGFELVGTTVALIYLNIHWMMFARGSTYFAPLFIWQKIIIAAADIIYLFILTTIIALGAFTVAVPALFLFNLLTVVGN